MRRLVVTLDGLAALREAAAAADVDLCAAATLARLAGAHAVRLGVTEELAPVRERDVYDVRRAARSFELSMSPSQSLLKVALEARPDRVVLAGESLDGRAPKAPLDLSGRGAPLGPFARSLGEAGIPVAGLVAPDPDAVKAAHAEGLRAVELYTGSLVDLPPAEREAELTGLGDAVRIAAKLHLGIGIAGGLGFETLRTVLAAAPAVECAAVGRAAVARAALTGMDRAVRDLRALVDA